MLLTPPLTPLITGPANIQWPTGGLYSATPAYTSWSSGGGTTIVRNQVYSPDYKLNGCTQVEDTANSLHSFARINQVVTTAVVPYVHRVWAKRIIGGRNIQVACFDSTLGVGSATVSVDLNSGDIITAAAVTGTFTSPSATTAYWGRGWWLTSLYFTGIVDTGLSIIYRMLSGTAATYTGDGASKIAMWGTDWRAV